jgi:hypothetical protein
MEWLPALILYVVAAAAHGLMQRRDFGRNPAKAQRYAVLPIRYKLACWFLVLPAIAALPLVLWLVYESPFLAVLAHVGGLIGFAALEVACVSVYRRHGLLN